MPVGFLEPPFACFRCHEFRVHELCCPENSFRAHEQGLKLNCSLRNHPHDYAKSHCIHNPDVLLLPRAFVFSAVKRKARGYSNTEYFIAMLYFTAGKLNLPSYPSHGK